MVKFGGEVHSDVFAARLSYALGYAVVPTYFVESGTIENVSGLKRAKFFVARDGSFRNAPVLASLAPQAPLVVDREPLHGIAGVGRP